MLTYVLDASSVIRLVDKETGTTRVSELLVAAAARHHLIVISAVNWGEVVYTITRRPGSNAILLASVQTLRDKILIVPVTAERAVAAGFLKLKYKVAYADALVWNSPPASSTYS